MVCHFHLLFGFHVLCWQSQVVPPGKVRCLEERVNAGLVETRESSHQLNEHYYTNTEKKKPKEKRNKEGQALHQNCKDE